MDTVFAFNQEVNKIAWFLRRPESELCVHFLCIRKGVM